MLHCTSLSKYVRDFYRAPFVVTFLTRIPMFTPKALSHTDLFLSSPSCSLLTVSVTPSGQTSRGPGGRQSHPRLLQRGGLGHRALFTSKQNRPHTNQMYIQAALAQVLTPEDLSLVILENFLSKTLLLQPTDRSLRRTTIVCGDPAASPLSTE